MAGIWWFLRPIRNYLGHFGKFAPLIYILVYALNTISVFPPIALLSLTAGLVFGYLWGAVYLMLGALLGTTATFLIARFFGQGLVEKLLKSKFKHLDDLLERKGFIAILFFRVIPVVPYEVLNYASGLTRIRFRNYFFATFLGIIPGVIITTFFGDKLGRARSLIR